MLKRGHKSCHASISMRDARDKLLPDRTPARHSRPALAGAVANAGRELIPTKTSTNRYDDVSYRDCLSIAKTMNVCK
jgi:hypothetical protein